MYDTDQLERVTHLILDEVHERDRFCDFLLGVVRSRLAQFPRLRLILMSAALDIKVLSNYFSDCPVLQVEGKCFPVHEYYLEDVLSMMNYLGQDKSPTNVPHIMKPATAARPCDVPRFDSCIQKCFTAAQQTDWQLMIDAIDSRCMPVDYQHSQTKLTPLMVAAGSYSLFSKPYIFFSRVKLKFPWIKTFAFACIDLPLS